MMSLFNSFDLLFFPLSYLVFLSFLLLFFSCLMKTSIFSALLSEVMSLLNKFFLSIKPQGAGKYLLISLNSLFFTIFFLNFCSIFSFNFAYSSQISTVMSLSLSFWLGLFTFYGIYNCKGFVSHCVPEGTPIYLTFPLFLIELVSNLIRPITLTVRLTANILAGHLLMILLSQLALSVWAFTSLYVLLNLVEFFVSLVQSYIFVTMMILYYSDVS